MIELIYILVFLVVAFSIGRKITALFKIKFTKIEELIINITMGSGSLIYLTFFLGIFHLIYIEVYLILTLLVILLFFKEVIYFGYLISSLGRSILRKLKLNLFGILLIISLFFITINLITAFAPVSAWDATAYHLGFAENYKRHHSLTPNPSALLSYMPIGMTMLYTISELFSPGTFSALIAYAFSILASLGIYSVVKKYSSNISAIIASLIFLTLPAIIQGLTQANADPSLSFFFVSVVIILLKYIEEYNNKTKFNLLIILSMLMGFCLSIKLTGIFLLISVVMGIFSYWLIYKKKVMLKHITILLLLSFLFLSPWLIRAYIYTENPVYPYGYSIFGGKYLREFISKQRINEYHSEGIEKNLINSLLVLWNMTFRSKEAFRSILGISPFYIMILPLIFLFYRDIKNLSVWVLLFIIATIICIITFQIQPRMRYLFPALPLFSILTGMNLGAMIKQRTLKIIVVSLFIISLIFSFAIWWGINDKNIYFLASSQTKEEYYSNLEIHNPYEAMQWINKNTQADSRIFLYMERRAYYLNRDYIFNQPYLFYINFYDMNNSNDFLGRLEELNASHFLINEGGMEMLKGSYAREELYNISWPIVRGAIRNMTLVYNESQILIYKI